MRRLRVDPMEYPIEKGESWYLVHPNTNGSEFRIPAGAITLCLEDFLDFKKNTVYSVLSADNHNGWVTVASGSTLYDMPQYLFARKFDAEAFVVGRVDPAEMENATKFDYEPTLPKFYKG